MTHLLVFGDSIVQGAWDPFGGWVQRVRTALDEEYLYDPEKRFVTFNMGVAGNTTASVLQRFPGEMKARYDETADLIILFGIGTNDSLLSCEAGTNQVSEEDFLVNLAELTAQARRYTDKIGFLGLTPVNEDDVNPLPWMPDYGYWFSAVHNYNALLKNFCAEEDIAFVDLWQSWVNEPWQDWLFDGVHPNAAGHQKIARAVLRDFLKPLGWPVRPEKEGGYVTAN